MALLLTKLFFPWLFMLMYAATLDFCSLENLSCWHVLCFYYHACWRFYPFFSIRDWRRMTAIRKGDKSEHWRHVFTFHSGRVDWYFCDYIKRPSIPLSCSMRSGTLWEELLRNREACVVGNTKQDLGDYKISVTRCRWYHDDTLFTQPCLGRPMKSPISHARKPRRKPARW